MNAEELADAVDELDTRLERLRVLMEQYFQGIEKIPPLIVQKDVDRRIWILRREKIRNTGTRFRFQQIIQRYNTFSSYWQRIMREIENGTYKRHVLRAKKRFGIDAEPNARPEPPPPPPIESEAEAETELELDPDDDLSDLGDLGPLPTAPKPLAPPPKRSIAPSLPGPPALFRPPSPAGTGILASKVESDDDLDSMLDEALGTGPARPSKPEPRPVVAPRPPPAQPSPFAAPRPTAHLPTQSAPPRPPAPKPPSPPAAKPPGSEEYRRVYSQYVEARRRNGESTAGITYETLAKSLRETTEKLKVKSGGKPIDYEVTTKDGKTILKPVVR